MKREFVFPVRVIKCFGNVQNPESLLRKKPLQIGLTEPDCLQLQNNGGEAAGILLDFGRELCASVRILTHVTSDRKQVRVHVTCGESVSEALSEIGEKNATNDHAIRDMDYRLPAYSDMTLNETGFRFVCIRLLEENASVSVKAVVAAAVSRDLPYLGNFRCSNETLNRIYDTAAYTCHLCLQNYIWDGIKRDRLVWVGDIHPEMLTVRSVFGPIPLMSETLTLIREATPLPGWMNRYPTYSLWWMIILRDWYFYTGNEEFLFENRDYVLSLTEQILAQVNDDGSDNLPKYFLDWPTNKTEAGVQGSRALLVLALEAAAELCALFGENGLPAACQTRVQILRNAPWSTITAKQTVAFTALAGCCDEHDAAEIILRDGAEGFSTFMSYYLLKVAAKKDISAALKVLEDYYGAMLKLGATTFWEDFNIEWAENAAPIDREPLEGEHDVHGDYGAYCYLGFRHSLCHGWSSGPTAFLAEEVLGIRVTAVGCRRVELCPNLGDLDWAEGSYPTPLGVLTVCCQRNDDGTVKTTWQAPKGMEVICR